MKDRDETLKTLRSIVNKRKNLTEKDLCEGLDILKEDRKEKDVVIPINIDKIMNEKLLKYDFKQLRQSAQLTKKELSVKCGLSIPTISNIESLNIRHTSNMASILSYLNALGYTLDIKEAKKV